MGMDDLVRKVRRHVANDTLQAMAVGECVQGWKAPTADGIGKEQYRDSILCRPARANSEVPSQLRNQRPRAAGADPERLARQHAGIDSSLSQRTNLFVNEYPAGRVSGARIHV